MMRGMLAAVSGLKAHGTMLDVVADNIANVNTVGFKSSRTSFEDAFAQTLRAAGAPVTGGIGGTNATQIGLGVQLGGTESNMTEGSIQSTGNPLDAAIQGNGWFAVTSDPAVSNASWVFTRDGDFTTDSSGNLVTREGQYVVGFAVNSGTGAVTTTPGTPAKIAIPANAQSVAVGANGMVTAIVSGAQYYCGQIALQTFSNEDGLVRQSGNTYVSSTNAGPNGYAAGTTPNGVLNAPASATAGTGSLVPGALEMSNVDLAAEFTNMITAERGFQANSRAITTADEMLQDLVNLKH